MPAARKVTVTELVDEILAHTVVDAHGCMVTTRGRHGRGYARVSIPACLSDALGLRRGSDTAHRVVAHHVLGPVPEGQECRHLCGRGAQGCVTPEHLAYGTRRQNVQDTARHGRQGVQKLTHGDAEDIRLWCRSLTQRAVAKLYGLGEAQVSRIVNGKAHVVPSAS